MKPRAIVVLLLVIPTTALGQATDESAEATDTSDSDTTSTESSTESSTETSEDREARVLYEAGRTAFEAGLYDNALESFQRAAELSPNRAELHYNVALSAERLRRDAIALAAYLRFRDLAPDSPKIAEVRSRIVILQEAQSETQPTAVSNTGPIVELVLAGVAGAGAVAGGIWLAERIDALEPCSQPDAVCDRESTVERQRNAAIGTVVGAGALAIALTIVGLVTWKSQPDESRAVRCGPGGCTVAF